MIRRTVRALQKPVANLQAGMNDLLAPIRGNVACHESAFVRHHERDLGAQTLFVKLECGLALAVEIQIRIHLHRDLLSSTSD
jgi:hypothetical protein